MEVRSAHNTNRTIVDVEQCRRWCHYWTVPVKPSNLSAAVAVLLLRLCTNTSKTPQIINGYITPVVFLLFIIIFLFISAFIPRLVLCSHVFSQHVAGDSPTFIVPRVFFHK